MCIQMKNTQGDKQEVLEVPVFFQSCNVSGIIMELFTGMEHSNRYTQTFQERQKERGDHSQLQSRGKRLDES